MHSNMNKQLDGLNFSGKESNNGKRVRKPNSRLHDADVDKKKKGSSIILILIKPIYVNIFHSFVLR